MNLSLTYEELDTLTDCLSVTKKMYPLSWSTKDEETFEKIREAYLKAFKERSENGEEESRTKKQATRQNTI